MGKTLQPVRGTHDILPEEFGKFHAVVTLARELATLYGFKEMATPLFEPTEVFSRSMGETSDVVSKEMFTFDTKGGERVTLRPEFTAGIVRAFLSNGMQQHLPLKLFSTGPLFRYERPQKGRQRQFHQVNFEWLGDGSARADIGIILLAGHLLHSISGPKSCKLLINTLGDAESRAKYREKLVEHLTPYVGELSEDSQRRLISNPLRILDSKDPRDKKITEDAPKIEDYLNNNAKRRFEDVCKALGQEGVHFVQDIEVAPSLVRGLDYYTDTVFEFVAETGELGAQNTVLAGGRYDGLVEQMGGKPTPAIGFAAGLERLSLLTYAGILKKEDDIKIVVMPAEGLADESVYDVSEALRIYIHDTLSERRIKRHVSVDIDWEGTHKKRMERADKRGATHAVILSPEAISVRDMKERQQQPAALEDFRSPDRLIRLFNIDSRLRGNDKA